MLRRFISYCEKNHLLQSSDTLLLAVSGGVDSMTLAHLLLQCKLKFAVAHCNFSLRGAESDGDAAFVAQWCKQHNIPVHITQFDTHQYVRAHKLSTQMAARELRYAWFEELCAQHRYNKIAVAHNANDNTETFLLNFTRGAGIKGLCGMQPAKGNIIRPLLFATRDEIVQYAQAQQIAFREDSSNSKTDYARNRIRHNVIPELEKINPSFVTTSQHTLHYLSQAAGIIAEEGKRVMPEICTTKGNELHIAIAALLKTAAPAFWLHEILHEYGFSGELIQDLFDTLEGQAGKRFCSGTHVALKDRETIIVYKRSEDDKNEIYWIDADCTPLEQPFKLHIERKEYSPDFIIPTDASVACLDAAQLQFPLQLRIWRDGDAFVPLGMKGEKKVSDFLIDKKVPLHEKQTQWVLQSGDDIVWLVGQRIDERYKITSRTKKLMIFSLAGLQQI